MTWLALGIGIAIGAIVVSIVWRMCLKNAISEAIGRILW